MTSPDGRQACMYCGTEILPGDLVYETDEGWLHDECFYDHMRVFAGRSGWRHCVYGQD